MEKYIVVDEETTTPLGLISDINKLLKDIGYQLEMTDDGSDCCGEEDVWYQFHLIKQENK